MCIRDRLRDGWTLLEREGETLTLYGMERKRPRPLPASCPRPVIALAHQPQWLYLYEAAGWDLVISGHAPVSYTHLDVYKRQPRTSCSTR